MPAPSTLTMASDDIREMSFQSVIDEILHPSGIKMGGFPVEMFVDLTDAEQQKFMCNIWYDFIVKYLSACCPHIYTNSFVVCIL